MSAPESAERTWANDGSIARDVPDRQPQVQAEIDGLHDDLEKLGSVVAQLDGRLRHVCRPEGPSVALRDGDRETLVPQAERIHGLRESVVAQMLMLSDLLDRLEV